jgi:signal transduction histidine kinase
LEPVYGSRVQIAQVLLNLLRNAIEALEALAGVDTNERLVKIAATNTGSGVWISIADTGPGFAQDVDLFEQFHTTKKDGMGLGLSICRTIVEAHRGEIWYQRDENGNSQFCFSLPALGPRMTADKLDELQV